MYNRYRRKLNMRKAKEILFLLAMIFGCLSFLGLVGGAIAFFVGSNNEQLRQMIEEALANSGMAVDGAIISALCITYGVSLIICAVFAAVAVFLAWKARFQDDKKLFILNIVFGVLGGSIFNILAAIFGLVAASRAPAQIEE